MNDCHSMLVVSSLKEVIACLPNSFLGPISTIEGSIIFIIRKVKQSSLIDKIIALESKLKEMKN